MDKCSIHRIFWWGVSRLNRLSHKEAPPFICSELETQSLFENLQLLCYRGSEQSPSILTKLRSRKEEITFSGILQPSPTCLPFLLVSCMTNAARLQLEKQHCFSYTSSSLLTVKRRAYAFCKEGFHLLPPSPSDFADMCNSSDFNSISPFAAE